MLTALWPERWSRQQRSNATLVSAVVLMVLALALLGKMVVLIQVVKEETVHLLTLLGVRQHHQVKMSVAPTGLQAAVEEETLHQVVVY